MQRTIDKMSFEFNVFTLNCWGIPIFFISKDRLIRMEAIAKLLSTSNYDVVCLQEVWTDRDYKLIRKKVKDSFPYSHYFYSGVIGSGVCIFSKHEIHETLFRQWCLNGYIHKLHHGDWFGGKGVGLCKLSVNNFNVNIYSTHFHAEYNPNSDEYRAHRILQAYDTAQFIRFTSEAADLVILAGDLNTEEGDLAHRVMCTVPGLLDAFKEAKNYTKTSTATFENLQNSYTPSYLKKRNTPGKRIDYVMYHPGSKLQVSLKNYELPLPKNIPEHECSYSDHEAVAITLCVNKRKEDPPTIDLNERNSVLKECLDELNKFQDNLIQHKLIYFSMSILLLILLIASLVADVPYGYHLLVNVFRVIVTILIVFSSMMAFIWNKIENNGIQAGKKAIEVSLKISTKNF